MISRDLSQLDSRVSEASITNSRPISDPRPEPSISISSAICRLDRVDVPSGSIDAVMSAMPGRSAGSVVEPARSNSP